MRLCCVALLAAFPGKLKEPSCSLRPEKPCQGSCGRALLLALQLYSLPRGQPLPWRGARLQSENTTQQILTDGHIENYRMAKKPFF